MADSLDTTSLRLPQLGPRAPEPSPLPSKERIRELAAAVAGEVRFGHLDRMLYATDASLYQVEPLGVVIPADIDDAARAVTFCLRNRIPVLPRGGGTSLAGQCTNRAVVIDCSPNCRAILDIDPAARACRVQPGITVDELNDALLPTGLFWPPDPATSRHANVGGCIGNNAAGARSILYGRTSENLLGVDVLLADGRRLRLDQGAALRDPAAAELTTRIVEIVVRHERLIRERFPKTIRRNAGYALDMVLQALDRGGLAHVNLAHLLAGSEGTLAFTLEAQLRLAPLPRARALAVIAFAELDHAIDAVQPILATGPSAVEMLDDMIIGLARANAEYRRYVELLPDAPGGRTQAVLYVEYFAQDDPAELDAKCEWLKERFGHSSTNVYTGAGAMLSAWKLRKAGEPLLHGVPGSRKPVTFIEDNAIPVERLGEFVRRLRGIVASCGTTAAYWAHASVGVLHVRPLLDLKNEDDLARMRDIALRTADLARELGGVMSGEHGDGRARGPLLERFYGPELMQAFRQVKAVFDPLNLFNPGNIVDPGPLESITRNLRVHPVDAPARVPSIRTYYRYHDQHGFEGAVEMCNGAGVCRKKRGGTMCPSYMATLDERHSTRGRGNALRLALTGQLASSADAATPIWNDPDTIATLDLCLSCKACKSECPSNVDIARLKAEYTAQRYRETAHPPLAASLMGRIRTLNRLGSITPRLANRLGRSAPVRAMLRACLKIDPRRSLPPFARPLSTAFRAADRTPPDPRDSRPTVAIFADCFTMYNEPGIGHAARLVLEAFGYRVLLPRHGCCGRAMISLGLLPDAIDTADATLDSLAPWIRNPTVNAILFLEPSCLSAVKDDWIDLHLRTPLGLRRALAAKSFLVEEFLDRAWAEHPRHPRLTPPEHPIYLHGHCHQKALWGIATSANLLRRLAHDHLHILETGCCGMAGAFGFTTDRFDLSQRIGELALFPALRNTPEGAIIAAPGTSCRHQVHDALGLAARHPVEVVASLLQPRSHTLHA
ncbi:MAG: FAD-binding protein [Phycisphaeraceae bacterium]|nr:FAD-binding protein [Phycisphaeraceae bacterium]